MVFVGIEDVYEFVWSMVVFFIVWLAKENRLGFSFGYSIFGSVCCLQVSDLGFMDLGLSPSFDLVI